MAKELKHISFEEFAASPARFLQDVIDEHEPVVVENQRGQGVEIRPLPAGPAEGPLADEDYRSFRSAFGGWADVDTDRLKEEIYESRRSSRPPVNL